MNNNIKYYALALAIFFGAVLSSYIIGNSLLKLKLSNRVVNVKGLSEREIQADLAVWNIKFSVTDDNLEDALAAMENRLEKTRAFLQQYGIETSDISRGYTEVFDKLAQQYIDQNNVALRYRVNTSLFVKTNNITAVAGASNNISDLIKQGIVIEYDGYNYSGPSFLFTKLNDIKPQMLAEATQHAKEAAEEFAKNSGSIVGKIRNASQGVFQYYSNENKAEEQSISKVVRVVIQVDYFLEK